MITQKIQVLIVDDNEPNRDMLARRLRRNDFDLSMATGGNEAIHMIRSNLYDLILLDIMMPEVDGYMVLKFIKNDHRLQNIPVIMISALEEMDSVMKCMEIGADDYLTKPFDPDLLKSAVNRCLIDKIGSISPSLNLNGENNNVSYVPKSANKINQVTILKSPDDTTNGTPTNSLTLDEVVHRIMLRGTINRKLYLYFSKAIFNTLFENSGLSDQETYQIHSVFEAIQSGRIKVVDVNSPSNL